MYNNIPVSADLSVIFIQLSSDLSNLGATGPN